MLYADADYESSNRCYQKISDPAHQPAMNKQFSSVDEFFGRSVEEYKDWLLTTTREQLDFVLLDLIRASADKKVLCDCHLTVEQALMFSEPSRVVFLIRDPSNLVDEYRERWDHQGFNQYINSASDVESAKETVSRTLNEINIKRIEDVKNSQFFWLERTDASTVEDTLCRVERHLGFINS